MYIQAGVDSSTEIKIGPLVAPPTITLFTESDGVITDEKVGIDLIEIGRPAPVRTVNL